LLSNFPVFNIGYSPWLPNNKDSTHTLCVA
jgi:hypothetical protein